MEREKEGLAGVKGHNRTDHGERKGSGGHYWSCGPAKESQLKKYRFDQPKYNVTL